MDDGRQVNIPLDATSIYFNASGNAEVIAAGGRRFMAAVYLFTKKLRGRPAPALVFVMEWAIGITPKNVVAVWVGNTDGEGRPGLVGVQTAAPILFDIFVYCQTLVGLKNQNTIILLCPYAGKAVTVPNIDCPGCGYFIHAAQRNQSSFMPLS